MEDKKKNIYDNFRKKIIEQDNIKSFHEENQPSLVNNFTSTEKVYKKKSNPKLVIFSILASFLCLYLLSILYTNHLKDKEDKYNSYKRVIANMENLNRDYIKSHSELEKIVKDLKKEKKYSKIELSEADNYLLNKEEKLFLQKEINIERGSEVKSMINTILKKNRELIKLHKKIALIKKNLRPPVMMKKHFGHEKIAIKFLVEEVGMTLEQAREKVSNVNMFDYTAPGLYVWNYYSDGFFGSFVTKGKSLKTPNEIKQIANKAFNEKYNKVVNSLQNETRERVLLENNFEKNKQDLVEKSDKIYRILKSSKNLATENDSLRYCLRLKDNKIDKLNSIHYNMLSRESAIDKKVITESIFSEEFSSNKLKYPYSYNLTKHNKIVLLPSQFKLFKFKNIKIYPEYYQKENLIKINFNQDRCEIIFSKKRILNSDEILIIAE